MRKDPNMLLRGATWYLRVAVPKRLQDIRAEQGIRSSKEVWRSLESGDAKTAKAKAVHVKAEIFRAFDEEERRYTQRPVPSLAQLQDAATAFRTLSRTSLTNERLLELPSAADAAAAAKERDGVLRALEVAPLADQDRHYAQLHDLEWVANADENLREDRLDLRDRLLEEMGRLDHSTVHPFIGDVARRHGFRIDDDSTEYRQLGHLLLKTWIKELDDADAAFMGLDEPIGCQDEALAAWYARPVGPEPHMSPSSLVVPVAPVLNVPAIQNDIQLLFAAYLVERFAGTSQASLLERRRTIAQFVEVVGLKDATQYRKTDMTAFKAALLKLPINAARDYPGLTTLAIIDSARADATLLAPKTVKLRLSIMGSFGKWLSENVDGVDVANFRTSAPASGAVQGKVKEFSDAEVRQIFLCPAFTGCLSERNQTVAGSHRIRDYRYWLPLLAAYTGCRLNELTQLRLADIVQIDDVLALRITDAGDGQSLKTRASERLVPVHTQLLAAGFLDYLRSVKASGKEVLFHDIPLDRNGRRSEAAGKRFRKFLVRLGIKSDGTRGGMHRFRHTVVEKLREAGNSDYEIALIVGHGTNTATMTGGYGSSRQMLLSQRRVVLESLTYQGLELAKLR